MKKVSVIIPLYNKEKFVAECLSSVCAQTLRDIEVICIDDGSTDGSAKVVERFLENDDRIILLRQKNSGAAVARNAGLKKADGTYVCFMDPDDWYPDSKVLEDLYVAAESSNANICGGSLYEYQNGSIAKEFSGSKAKYCFSQDGFVDYSEYQFDYGFTRFLYKTAFIRENNLEFPAYECFEDPVFFVKAMAAAKCFYALKRPSYVYRVAYRKVNWSNERLISLALGLCDVLELSRDRSLQELHTLELERVASSYLNLFYSTLTEPNETLGFALTRMRHAIDSRIVEGNKNLRNMLDALDNLMRCYWLLLGKDASSERVERPAADEPLVSVVVPVFNVEKYVAFTLGSLVSQTLENIEIIVVDDGSTDASLMRVTPFEEADKRIRVIRKENGGLSSARNAGMRVARGKYLVFLDSDDLLAPEALENLYITADSLNLDDLFFSAESFYETPAAMEKFPNYKTYYTYKGAYEEPMTGQEFFVALRENGDFKPSACLQFLRRDFLSDHSITFYDGILHEDNLFTMECLACAQRVFLQNEQFYKRRVHEGSIMTSEKGLKNAYGYYCSAQGFIAFLKEQSIEIMPSSLPYFRRQIAQFIDEAMRYCLSASPSSLESFLSTLPASDNLQFSLTVMTRVDYERVLKKKDMKIKTQETSAKEREKKIRESNSYRIGRAVTSPLRWLKRSIKSLKKRIS